MANCEAVQAIEIKRYTKNISRDALKLGLDNGQELAIIEPATSKESLVNFYHPAIALLAKMLKGEEAESLAIERGATH